jgi:hypothetical protein
MFTADTGAARTVISTKAFKQIPRDKQPQLKKSCTLAGADGQPLVELGKNIQLLTFNIYINNRWGHLPVSGVDPL